MFAVLTVLTGVIYPAAVTAFSQAVFPKQANGSLLNENGRIAGSKLLAQKFQDTKYFWPRPSAADYATVASGASNLGPTSAALKEAVEKRKVNFQKANGLEISSKIPADMLFTSGSGLDPHISPEAAKLQISRVAKARNLNPEAIARLVDQYTEPPQFGILGKPVVNVLQLNLALDSL